MKEKEVPLLELVFVLLPSILLICIISFPTYTSMYGDGVRDTHKEAYSKGFMVKEITKDDKIIYKWKEEEK